MRPTRIIKVLLLIKSIAVNVKIRTLKKQDPFLTKMYGGLMILLVSVAFAYFAYYEYKNGTLGSSPRGLKIFFIISVTLGPIIGTAFIFAAFSKKFSRKYFSEFEPSPPVIECKECFYDLRGSVLAGSKKCPECGAVIPVEQIEQILKLNRLIKSKQQVKTRSVMEKNKRSQQKERRESNPIDL